MIYHHSTDNPTTIEVARDRLAADAKAHRHHYADGIEGVGETYATPFAAPRYFDPPLLDVSNWAVISADLVEFHGDEVSGDHRPECEGDQGCTCRPDAVIEYCDGCRTDVLAVRAFDATGEALTDAMVAAIEWLDALDRYPVADDEDLTERETDELVEWVADEVDGGDVESEWVAAVLADIWEYGSRVEDVPYSAIEESISAAYAARVEAVGRTFDEWARLRLVGDGQLTIWGETVRVPSPPDLDALDALVDGLPWSVERVVDESDDHDRARSMVEQMRDEAAAYGREAVAA